MPTDTITAPQPAPLPTYHRIMEAAAGESPWNESEAMARNQTPSWLVAECQAHVEMSLLEDSDADRQAHYREISGLLSKLPTEDIRSTALELLQTYLPDSESQRLAVIVEPEKKVKRKPLTWLGFLAMAATLMLCFTLVFNRSGDGGNSLESTQITASGVWANIAGLRGTGDRIYGDDEFAFEAKIKTTARRAWIINMYGDPSTIPVEAGHNRDGEIVLRCEVPAEAKDCIEQFIVLVADGDAISDTPAERMWLVDLQTELVRIDPQTDHDGSIAQAAIRRHLERSGYRKPVLIEVERFVHHKEPRR